MFFKKKSDNKIVSLRTRIDNNNNVLCYDSEDVVPSSLRSSSQKYVGKLSPLHVPMEDHGNKWIKKT